MVARTASEIEADDEAENICSEQPTCSQCIKLPQCLYCIDANFTQDRPRCILR